MIIQYTQPNQTDFENLFKKLGELENEIKISKTNTLEKISEIKKSSLDQQIKFNQFWSLHFVKHLEISSIPKDLLMKILLFVDKKNLFNALTTCKKWSCFSNNPLFLRELVKIHHPNIFQLGKEMDLKAWLFYGKAPFIFEKLKASNCKIAEDQKTILMINIFTVVVSSPIWLPLMFKTILKPTLEGAVKSLGYICDSLDKVNESQIMNLIDIYLENNPGETLESAMKIVSSLHPDSSMFY